MRFVPYRILPFFVAFVPFVLKIERKRDAIGRLRIGQDPPMMVGILPRTLYAFSFPSVVSHVRAIGIINAS